MAQTDNGKIEGASVDAWTSRCAGSERDVKEAKFLLTANVVTLFFLKEYYGLEPLKFAETNRDMLIFAPFLISAFLSIFSLAAAFARERAIYAILAGKELTAAWDQTVIYAKNRVVSRLLTWSFIIGLLTFCAGVLMVIILAERPQE